MIVCWKYEKLCKTFVGVVLGNGLWETWRRRRRILECWISCQPVNTFPTSPFRSGCACYFVIRDERGDGCVDSWWLSSLSSLGIGIRQQVMFGICSLLVGASVWHPILICWVAVTWFRPVSERGESLFWKRQGAFCPEEYKVYYW